MARRPPSQDRAVALATDVVKHFVIELQKDRDMRWAANSDTRLAQFRDRLAAQLKKEFAQFASDIRAQVWHD
jgi:hypothetical protein